MTEYFSDEFVEVLSAEEDRLYFAGQDLEAMVGHGQGLAGSREEAKEKAGLIGRLGFGEKGKAYKAAKAESKNFDSEIEQQQAYVESLDNACRQHVINYMNDNDEWFPYAVNMHENLGILEGATIDFIQNIEIAQQEISEAIGMEWMDMMTYDSTIDVFSTIETMQAQQAIEVVQDHARAYQNTLREFSEFVQGRPDLDINASLWGSMGTEFFMGAFGMGDSMFYGHSYMGGSLGFDFGSWFALDALQDAAYQMNDLHSEVVGVLNQVQGQLSEVEQGLEQAIDQVREEAYDEEVGLDREEYDAED